MFDKLKSSRFVGTQLSRLKMGQSYYAIIVSTVNAVSLLSLAFHVSLLYLLLLFPVLLLGTYGVGYYLDKHDINAQDALKSIEMSHRFLSIADQKAQEFQLALTRVTLAAFRAWSHGETFDANEVLAEAYREYARTWRPPNA